MRQCYSKIYACCRYEVAEFQRRVRQNYKQLKDEIWVEVCADGSLEEVESKLLDIITKELAKERGGVSKLWQVFELQYYMSHEEDVALLCLWSKPSS